MYRYFENKLQAWEEKSQPEPMLITGPRQVGKTWLIRHFCEKTYEDYAYFNFEAEPGLKDVFEGSLEPGEILRKLGALRAKPIRLNTAIVFDEVQECEKAITSLKYFCEALENYRIICAGSLLSVKMHRFESSFPVGKVRIEQMGPLTFDEFLLASGEELLMQEISLVFSEMRKLPVHCMKRHYGSIGIICMWVACRSAL